MFISSISLIFFQLFAGKYYRRLMLILFRDTGSFSNSLPFPLFLYFLTNLEKSQLFQCYCKSVFSNSVITRIIFHHFSLQLSQIILFSSFQFYICYYSLFCYSTDHLIWRLTTLSTISNYINNYLFYFD